MPRSPRSTRSTSKSSTAPSETGFRQLMFGPNATGLELLGLLMMLVAILLGLSMLSYHAADYANVQAVSLRQILSFEKSPALLAKNWLGPVGALTSHFFVYTLFGYFSILFTLIMGGLGWALLRRKPVQNHVWRGAMLLWSMMVYSMASGWIYLQLEPYSTAWAGNAGIALARMLELITGTVGSGVIAFLLAVITGVLLLDADLQGSLDRVQRWFHLLGLKIQEWKEIWQDKREESAARKAREKEEAERKKLEESRYEDSIVRNQPETADRIQKAKSISTAPSAKAVATPSPEITEEITQPDDSDYFEAPNPGLSDAPPQDEVVGGEAPDIEIIVGQGDEAAGQRDLDRQNREKSGEQTTFRYQFPPKDLLEDVDVEETVIDEEEIRRNIKTIEDKLEQHKIAVKKREDGKSTTKAIVGPTVTLYELYPEDHVKISRIQSYANDLKMATASLGIRIIAPIPGKNAVGIEVPNRHRQMVHIRSLIDTKKFVETDMDLPVVFGKTIDNEVFMVDLAKLPHLLMAGATGAGKSVGINTIITSLLYKVHPDNLKFVMIDPKKIELSLFRNIQHHYLAYLPDAEEPIVTDTSKALETLNSVTAEMDDRYELLKMAAVRDIKAYNKKFKSGVLEDELGHRHLPYIVVLIDELADLMITAGRQIEEPIARIAQLARAVGIHLVIATQRPSVNVITGTIKANFPARIAYQVASKVDSRTILDSGGADELVGKGDMLFSSGAGMTRVQNAFVSTEEVERIAGFIQNQKGYNQPFLLPKVEEDGSEAGSLDDIDDLFKEAAKVVLLHQQGSVSLLQRKLKVGYNRAGRLIDQLFSAGVVGPYQGSSAREVLIQTEEELQHIFDEIGV